MWYEKCTLVFHFTEISSNIFSAFDLLAFLFSESRFFFHDPKFNSMTFQPWKMKYKLHDLHEPWVIPVFAAQAIRSVSTPLQRTAVLPPRQHLLCYPNDIPERDISGWREALWEWSVTSTTTKTDWPKPGLIIFFLRSQSFIYSNSS